MEKNVYLREKFTVAVVMLVGGRWLGVGTCFPGYMKRKRSDGISVAQENDEE